MIPFGHDVESALADRLCGACPLLLVSDEPQRIDGRKVGAWSRWDAAYSLNRIDGARCMVLPFGADIESFRYPQLPKGWQRVWNYSLAVWAWEVPKPALEAMGVALVRKGFDSVLVIGTGSDAVVHCKAC